MGAEGTAPVDSLLEVCVAGVCLCEVLKDLKAEHGAERCVLRWNRLCAAKDGVQTIVRKDDIQVCHRLGGVDVFVKHHLQIDSVSLDVFAIHVSSVQNGAMCAWRA